MVNLILGHFGEIFQSLISCMVFLDVTWLHGVPGEECPGVSAIVSNMAMEPMLTPLFKARKILRHAKVLA